MPAGKTRRAARAMGTGRMGAGRVPRIRPSPDESVADLRGRDPSDATCPHIRLDATHIECRGAGRVRPTGRKRGAVPGILKAVLAERGPEPVGEPCQFATARIERFRPKAAEVPEGAGADAPAHPDLPCGHRVGLRTDDVQGRADREPRRRSRVVLMCNKNRSE